MGKLHLLGIRARKLNTSWFVYVLKCKDETFYTGITNDMRKRLDTHNKGVGAKYTASRRPVTLIYLEFASDRSSASKREAEIKKMKRKEKIQIIYG